MNAIRRREFIIIAAIALLSGLISASPLFDLLHAQSLDALTALRWRVFGNKHEPAESRSVVIALDEESYRTPPFKGTPTITWTREIGRVLTAVVDGGAKVIGFDVIFPTSIEQSEIPADNETLGARLRGFDRDFLRSLALAARAGKVVLGEIQRSNDPIVPAPGQRIAVGQQRNIRSLNIFTDADEVVRRVPLMLTVSGKQAASMSLELASRALGEAPALDAKQGVTLGGYRVPAHLAETMTVNFAGGSNDIPTYSLADLRACIEKGDAEFFRRNFQGKVVLLGTVLDYEDLKLTTKRFATAGGPPPAERCAMPRPAAETAARDTISGVYIHATAVNNLLRHEAATEFGRVSTMLIAVTGAALGALGAFLLPPTAAALAFGALALVWTAASTIVFQQNLALPLLEPLLACVLALIVTIAFRLVVSDKDKRFLRRSFSLYLAPAIIEKMMSSKKMPALGGEIREVTVFFSDVAGFSAFSEKMPPAELVALMNRYLSAMTEIIEEEGGFVDKYIGDAIVAVFGAPLDSTSHAIDAVHTALRCHARLNQLNAEAAVLGQPELSQRIGLNSGQALVGNIGSPKRFNYTAMGDVVNLASRIEGANKFFGTSVLVSESTMELTAGTFKWREIDGIRVKGRFQPLSIYEPLAKTGQENSEQAVHAAAYSQGLARWRARDFEGAAQSFEAVAFTDPPSTVFMARAKEMMASPPGPSWEPVNNLEEK